MNVLYAADTNDKEFMKFLLKNGEDINYTDEFGETALHKASRNGNVEMINFLIKNGSNINALPNQSSPLHRAAHYGNTQIVEILLKHGALINALNEIDVSPLNEALYFNNTETAMVLLQNDAEYENNGNYNEDHTALSTAVSHKNFLISILLIWKNADLYILRLEVQNEHFISKMIENGML